MCLDMADESSRMIRPVVIIVVKLLIITNLYGLRRVFVDFANVESLGRDGEWKRIEQLRVKEQHADQEDIKTRTRKKIRMIRTVRNER